MNIAEDQIGLRVERSLTQLVLNPHHLRRRLRHHNDMTRIVDADLPSRKGGTSRR